MWLRWGEHNKLNKIPLKTSLWLVLRLVCAATKLFGRRNENVSPEKQNTPECPVSVRLDFSTLMFGIPEVTLALKSTSTGISAPNAVGKNTVIHTTASFLGLCSISLNSSIASDRAESCCDRPINVIKFAPNGDFFYTGSQDRIVRKWNVALVCLNVAKDVSDDWITDISASSNSLIVVTDRKHTMTVCDAETCKVVAKVRTRTTFVLTAWNKNTGQFVVYFSNSLQLPPFRLFLFGTFEALFHRMVF